nr:hypothetical protein [Tanacetum cinerariifolium]
MQTRSSSRLVCDQSSNPTLSTNPNPKGRNRRRSKQRIENLNLEEHSPPVITMVDQRNMAQLLQAPTEGYEDETVVPAITANNFELKHGLLILVQNKQFYGHDKEDSHAHIHYFNKITSTLNPDLAREEPPRSIFTWDDLVSKFINQFFPPSKTTSLRNEITSFQQRFNEYFSEAWNRFKDLLRAYPHHGFSELHQLDTFYNALNSKDQDSLYSAAGGNFLDKMPHECLSIIWSKSKVRYPCDKPVVAKVSTNASTSGVSPDVAELKDMVKALLFDKKGQNQSHALVKAVEESCVTYGGAHSYRNCPATNGNIYHDNIQEFVSQAFTVNYNQGNPGYRPLGMANQIRQPGFAQPNVQNNQNRFGPPQGFNHGNGFTPEHSYQAPAQQNQNVHLNELEKVKRMNGANMKAIQTQINMVKNKLRNEMKNSIQTSLSNQTNEIKNMMASLLQMNTASTSGSGSLPSNTVANPKGELKAITTRSGVVIDGPTVPTPPQSINPEVDERVEENFTDPDLAEYTIKVPPPPVQKYKPPSQREYVVHQRDPLHLNIPYPSRMLKQKQQKKDEKMLKALLSNKEKLQELGCNVLSKKLLDLDSTKDLHPPLLDNPLSGSTTYFSNPLLEEFADELPLKYDDNLQFDIESDIKEIEFLLYQDKDSSLKDSIDQKNLANLADIFVDSTPEMFTDEHALDYSSPRIFDEYDDDFLEVESDAENVYDDPFNSKGEKIKESKLLIDELDLLCDFLPPSEYDSFISQDFSRVDAFPSTNNEDKIFKPEIKNLEALLETEAGMKRAVEEKSAGLSQELERMCAQFSKLQAAFEDYKRQQDQMVEQRCAKMDARLDAMSLDFDEELYPHMLTAIAGRRWVIGHGLRLTMMKCAESLEMRQAFADVVSVGVAKGMSEGLKHGVEHGYAQRTVESLEAYDPEAEAKFAAALQSLKDLKYHLLDQLEGLKDAHMYVIMAALYLESDTGGDAQQFIRDLRPSSSQLTIPVYPEVHDPRNPWACKEEIGLADAITANINLAEEEKRSRIVCRTHGVGSVHHARSDRVPVSAIP